MNKVYITEINPMISSSDFIIPDEVTFSRRAIDTGEFYNWSSDNEDSDVIWITHREDVIDNPLDILSKHSGIAPDETANIIPAYEYNGQLRRGDRVIYLYRSYWFANDEYHDNEVCGYLYTVTDSFTKLANYNELTLRNFIDGFGRIVANPISNKYRSANQNVKITATEVSENNLRFIFEAEKECSLQITINTKFPKHQFATILFGVPTINGTVKGFSNDASLYVSVNDPICDDDIFAVFKQFRTPRWHMIAEEIMYIANIGKESMVK